MSFYKKITMKVGKLILMIALVLIISCKSSKEASNSENSIGNLKTIENKRSFLEQILKDDQMVRDSEKSYNLMVKYGKDSKEYLEYFEAQWKQDAINLQKIEDYLKAFGYPKKAELGEDAAITPWLVIHHTGDIDKRNRNFEYLYKAYLTGDIDDSQITMYLGRTHRISFSEEFEIEGEYQLEKEINQLIQKLGLKDKKLAVENSMKN
jgi:hypothetical protein